VPRNLESLVSLSEVLALVAILREQLSDLRTVPPRSLVALAGRPGKRRRPPDSKRVKVIVAAGKKAAGIPSRADDLELVKEGLRLVPEIRTPEVFGEGLPGEFAGRIVDGMSRRDGVGIRGLFPRAGKVAKAAKAGRTVARVAGVLAPLACELAIPALAPFILSPNVVIKGAAFAAVAGCGLFQLIDEE